MLSNSEQERNPEGTTTQAVDTADRLYPLHFFKSVVSLTPFRSVYSPKRKILQLLAQSREVPSKGDAGLFSGVEYIDPSKECRKIIGISGVHVVVGDIDGKFTQSSFNGGISALHDAGLSAVAYQTFNSTPEAQRWRVVVLLDALILPSAYRQCWNGLNGAFGGTLDTNAKDASRLSYLASHPAGQTRDAIIIGGAK